MPIYEYQCEKCHEVFSVLQSMGASEKETTCTVCGSRRVKKLLSSFACAGSSTGAGHSGGGHAGGS